MSAAVPLYRAVMLEVERWRVALNLPMDRFGEYAGLPDRYYPKALGADTPSGRQAQWHSVQVMLDAMMPQGFDLQIVPKRGAVLTAEGLKAKLLQLRAPTNPRMQRQLMSELGKKGGERGGAVRAALLSRRRLKQIARAGAKARWKNA